jgi:hypothetical protein
VLPPAIMVTPRHIERLHMGERGPQPGEGGAPRKVLDLEVARRAATLGCSPDEIAMLLGVARRTFHNHLKQDAALQEAVEERRAQGRTTLRRLQWQQANDGNTTMLIWLGKQLLGQRDRHEVSDDPERPALTFLHLTAMRAFTTEMLQQRETAEANGTTINGKVVASETRQPPTLADLMRPALE